MHVSAASSQRSFQSAAQPQSTFVNSMVQIAAKMQALRRDSTIPEIVKRKMLEEMRQQTKKMEEKLNLEAEQKKKKSIVDGSDEAAAKLAAQVRAANAASAPGSSTSAPTHTDPSQAAVPGDPKVAAVTPTTSTDAKPPATDSPVVVLGSVIDTYA